LVGSTRALLRYEGAEKQHENPAVQTLSGNWMVGPQLLRHFGPPFSRGDCINTMRRRDVRAASLPPNSLVFSGTGPSSSWTVPASLTWPSCVLLPMHRNSVTREFFEQEGAENRKFRVASNSHASASFAILGIYYQNNPFLGMFQLRFCLTTCETCSLLYVSVLKCSILCFI